MSYGRHEARSPSLGKLGLTKLVKIIEAFSRIWPMDSLGIKPREVADVLTTLFLRCITIVGGNLNVLQPRTVREKVLGRYTLVLGQCLDCVLEFSHGGRYSLLPLSGR